MLMASTRASMYCWSVFCVEKTRSEFGYCKESNQGEIWMDIWLFLTIVVRVKRLHVSKNDQFIDPVHEIPLDVFQWLKKKIFLFCLPTDPIFAIFRPRNIKSSWHGLNNIEKKKEYSKDYLAFLVFNLQTYHLSIDSMYYVLRSI